MPVRDKAVDTALRTVLDGTTMWFRNQPGNEQATVGSETMPRDEFNRRFWDPIDKAYERVVDSIDWNRVMLEASARHMALENHPEHDKRAVGDTYENVICPECVCEALMADTTMVSWEREPRAPRYHQEERDGD